MTTDAQAALAQVREALPKGSESVEWEWWTSNSFRRLSVRGSTVDGGVMYAYVAHDGQPDISIRQSDMALIAACSPANMTAILAHVEAQAAALVAAEAALADIGDADREPGDDIKWAERRAMQALPIVRNALACRCDMRTKPMSDMMTAVLSMPYDMAMENELSRRQFWDRAQQALAEIERLTAAAQHEADCVEAYRAQVEMVIRERDDHARWRADLADKLHDRETTISAAWEALRSAGVHSEATIDDGIRLLRRQLAECSQMLARQAATIRELTRP